MKRTAAFRLGPPRKRQRIDMQQERPIGYYRGGIRKAKTTSARNIFKRQLAAAQKIHKFKRTYNYGTISTSAISDFLSSYNFSLNDMPGYTDFTNLYDFYKVTGVVLTVYPYQTQNVSVSAVNNAYNVPIFYAVDTSDATNPGSINEICEYNDHKKALLYDGFKIYFKPKFADATSAPRDDWVATTAPSRYWYGIKVGIPPTGYATTLYMTWTIYIECKDPK